MKNRGQLFLSYQSIITCFVTIAIIILLFVIVDVVQGEQEVGSAGYNTSEGGKEGFITILKAPSTIPFILLGLVFFYFFAKSREV